mmetsp:Transcript_45614/g.138615  ORF Transcript_45614/g.138615 Transcript_45614/m.138615 type:complete len:754 (-) Transcript_45614:173-2434(-)
MATVDIESAAPPVASSSGGNAAGEHLDERLVARAALESAEDRLRSLCAAHAPTFVAVERRGAALDGSLGELLGRVDDAEPRVEGAERALGANDDKVTESSGVPPRGSAARDRDVEVKSASVALAALAERHRLRRRTLLQHSSLLELLELPSLMDACVRSNLYDEALSIAGFANTLERRHLLSDHHEEDDIGLGSSKASALLARQKQPQKKNDVVVNVVSEVRRREVDLRRHLLHRLRADVTMPQCLEVVTALRRLNGVELERRGHQAMTTGSNGGGTGDGPVDLERVHGAMELRLMVDFLEARDAWLDSGARATPATASTTAGTAAVLGSTAGSTHRGLGKSGHAGDGKSEQLLDGIERYRTRTFEIATQFLAIFRADYVSPSSSTGEDPSLSLLSMWTTRRVQLFLHRLRRDLSSGSGESPVEYDASALRDALDAASFFAASMGRVGADFRPLLPPAFEPRVAAAATRHWVDGVSSLRETLRVCRDAGIASPLFGTVTEGAASDAGSATTAVDRSDLHRTESGAPTSVTLPPPRKLLSLPPLARLVNAHLSGLNELRRCLLPGTFPTLRSSLDCIIGEVRSVLVANERAVLTPGLRGEAARLREAAGNMKDEFGATVEPYMRRSLEVAFGNLDLKNEDTEEDPKEEDENEGDKLKEEGDDKDDGIKAEKDKNTEGEKASGEDKPVGAGDQAEGLEQESAKEKIPEGAGPAHKAAEEGQESASGAENNDEDGNDDGNGGEGWGDDNLDDGLYD